MYLRLSFAEHTPRCIRDRSYLPNWYEEHEPQHHLRPTMYSSCRSGPHHRLPRRHIHQTSWSHQVPTLPSDGERTGLGVACTSGGCVDRLLTLGWAMSFVEAGRGYRREYGLYPCIYSTLLSGRNLTVILPSERGYTCHGYPPI